MSEEDLTEAQLDHIVLQLSAEGTVEPDTPEFDRLYAQLDIGRQQEVDDSFREFADNAVGDENWDR